MTFSELLALEITKAQEAKTKLPRLPEEFWNDIDILVKLFDDESFELLGWDGSPNFYELSSSKKQASRYRIFVRCGNLIFAFKQQSKAGSKKNFYTEVQVEIPIEHNNSTTESRASFKLQPLFEIPTSLSALSKYDVVRQQLAESSAAVVIRHGRLQSKATANKISKELTSQKRFNLVTVNDK